MDRPWSQVNTLLTLFLIAHSRIICESVCTKITKESPSARNDRGDGKALYKQTNEFKDEDSFSFWEDNFSARGDNFPVVEEEISDMLGLTPSRGYAEDNFVESTRREPSLLEEEQYASRCNRRMHNARERERRDNDSMRARVSRMAKEDLPVHLSVDSDNKILQETLKEAIDSFDVKRVAASAVQRAQKQSTYNPDKTPQSSFRAARKARDKTRARARALKKEEWPTTVGGMNIGHDFLHGYRGIIAPHASEQSLRYISHNEKFGFIFAIGKEAILMGEALERDSRLNFLGKGPAELCNYFAREVTAGRIDKSSLGSNLECAVHIFKFLRGYSNYLPKYLGAWKKMLRRTILSVMSMLDGHALEHVLPYVGILLGCLFHLGIPLYYVCLIRNLFINGRGCPYVQR